MYNVVHWLDCVHQELGPFGLWRTTVSSWEFLYRNGKKGQSSWCDERTRYKVMAMLSARWRRSAYRE
jgi:hypothetical protein